MIITILFAAAVMAAPYYGVIKSDIVSVDKRAAVSHTLIGPFDTEEACLDRTGGEAKSFDDLANTANTRGDLFIESQATCTQDPIIVRAFDVVAARPGKFYFQFPFIHVVATDGMRSAWAFAVKVTKTDCQMSAASMARNRNIVQAKCYWPNASLPEHPDARR